MSDVSNLDSRGVSALPDASLLNESRICPGCKTSVITDVGGVVVAFGQSFFHVDCFKCAKCGNQVTADTNLLLLSDGSPVCENCSYCCSICKLPILDEAIMAGDDSYHAHCFKCKVCKNRIDELMFAKTSQGIYCMPCHGERVARSRRHAQRQREREEARGREREREKAAAMGAGTVDGGPTSSREDAARAQQGRVAPTRLPSPTNHHSPPGSVHPPSRTSSRADPNAAHHRPPGPIRATKSAPGPHRGSVSSIPERQGSLHRANEDIPHDPSATSAIPFISGTPSSPPQVQRSTPLPDTRSFSASVPQSKAVPATSTSSRKNSFSEVRSNSPANGLSTLTVPSSDQDKSLLTRKSFDGDVRPLNLQLRPSHSAYSLNATASANANGLGLSDREQSRRDKRGSINPAMALSFANVLAQSPSTTASNAPAHGRESPRLPAPLRANTETLSVHSPRQLSSPTSADFTPQAVGRCRSGSAVYPSSDIKQLGQAMHPQSRPGSSLDHLPSRPGSRMEQHPRLAVQAAEQPYHGAASSGDGRRKEDRRPPSLHLANGNDARPQKSLADRPQPSPTLSIHTLRNSRPSSGTMELELPPTSSAPMSPSHHVDVPHGIESGTDTESEENRDVEELDLPPAPPPKELPRKFSNVRPPPLRLDAIDINPDLSDAGHTDSGEGNVESLESSPVERTSHATFIAPALPPIRISMGGTDFSDLLKSVGGSVLKLDQLKESKEESSQKSDSRFSSVLPSPSSIFASTPTSDGTLKSPDAEETPVRRGELLRKASVGGLSRRPNTAQERNESPTPSIPKDYTFPRLPANADAGRTGNDSRSQSPRVLEDRQGVAGSPVDQPSSSPSANPDGRRSLDVKSRTRKISTQSSRAATIESRESTHITVTSPDNMTSKPLRADSADVIKKQLQDVLSSAATRKDTHVTLAADTVQTMIALLEQRSEEHDDLKQKVDRFKRTSQQYMDGLTVAQAEYDRELKARRDAEAEVTRLRVLLSGQAVRLSAISGESKRHEVQKQLSRELSDNLSNLEKTLSQLKVERDMTLAEVEQLSASRSSTTIVDGESSPASFTRALSMRFDNIKTQYKLELLPLTEQREALARELTELKASRDAFLEETTMLNARNEELAQLNVQYVRRMEAAGIEDTMKLGHNYQDSVEYTRTRAVHEFSASVSSLTEESSESKFVKILKPVVMESPQVKPMRFIKWPGSRTPKESAPVALPDAIKPKPCRKEHVFQQINVLRVARCDHCGDKMWGSQLRCSSCNIAVHTRCVHLVAQCSQTAARREDMHPPVPLHPSMFGRDLIEQVRFDSRDETRFVPVIVEKCIDAVDALALDYEGIYRKTGGSGQSKVITQLFDNGDYRSFDLRDTDRFNDICSVTSVLKSYFRALPDPLLTYALHDMFIAAASIKDLAAKGEALTALVYELPNEHYHTTRALMLHLHRISERSDKNLMHARNLGVVFGPTLMRSRDPNAEFTDMAGKALSVEWLVENAPMVFQSFGPAQ